MNQTPRACTVFTFAICIAVIVSFGNAVRGNVPTLEWDPNPEPTVTGYNVYSGMSSGSYTRVTDVGLQTRLPLTNLTAAVTHYFAVTAYDANRLESPFSDEVWYTPSVDGMNAMQLPFEVIASNNSATIRFSGQAGQRCWIVASSDLQHWEQIQTLTLADNSLVEFADPDTDRYSMHFYRVISRIP